MSFAITARNEISFHFFFFCYDNPKVKTISNGLYLCRKYK